MSECCGSNMHKHHHGHHENHCACGCGCGCGCGSKHESEEGCSCADKFLELADEAWKELLMEKIKVKILANKGEHMDKLAEIIAIANGEKWKHKIGSKTKNNEFKDNLKEFLSSRE